MAAAPNNMPYESNTPIPSGSWSLWYHSPTEQKWTPNTYNQICTFDTFGSLHAALDALSDEALLNGFFFLMRDPLPPLWENKGNIHGGSYSMRISRKDASEVYQKYMLAAMIGEAMTSNENKVCGVCISPKKGFNIITIWNEDFSRFQDVADIALLHHTLGREEIRYMRHVDKKFN